MSMNNRKSNVAAQFTVKVFVNNRKVTENTYVIPAGSSMSITTISGVPEGAKYKARIVTKDILGSNKSVGKFKKMPDCIIEPTPTTIPVLRTPPTTEALRGPLLSDGLSVSTTTTTTVLEELSSTDDISSLIVGGLTTSPPTTLGPIEDALTKKSSVIVNNVIDTDTKVAIEDVSAVQISNDEVSLSIGLTLSLIHI